MEKKVQIVIPARYASSRLPGKPLVRIAGREMILRVADIAASVCRRYDDADYLVATDDPRIAAFCRGHGVPVVMTAESCSSGTERCWDAVRQLDAAPELIVNLQGDNPLCPPWVVSALIDAWRGDRRAQVFTPCVRLDWAEYDALKETKRTTPFSGTTVLVDAEGEALAFSKNIVPAIRREETWRESGEKPPVRRHVGLYAYTCSALGAYFGLEPSPYERAEGLEQMRFLHHRIPVKVVEVDYRGRRSTSGVDSPEDVARVEAILAEFGEFDL
jgi:3-deoxy-manno-octulosonate cytidylyltransferase (CMP-KDO synthetase)